MNQPRASALSGQWKQYREPNSGVLLMNGKLAIFDCGMQHLPSLERGFECPSCEVKTYTLASVLCHATATGHVSTPKDLW